LNPGNSRLHPWLYGQAQYYDRYMYQQLVFKFRSTTPVSTAGNVAYAEIIVNNFYDPRETVANNKQELFNRDNVSIFRATDHFDHGFECKRADSKRRGAGDPSGQELPLYYVKNPDQDTNSDVFFIYPGKVTFSFSVPANSVASGELYVEYKVMFSNPKLPTGGIGGDVRTDYFYTNGGQTTPSFKPFGTGTTPIYPQPGFSLGGYLDPVSNRYYFPDWLGNGYFLFTLFHDSSTSGTVSPMFFSTLTNCSNVSIFRSSGGAFYNSDNVPAITSAGQSQASTDIVIKIDSMGAWVTMTGLSMAGTAIASTLVVTQVNPFSVSTMLKNALKEKKEKLLQFFDEIPEELLTKFHKKLDKSNTLETKEITMEKIPEETKDDSWFD